MTTQSRIQRRLERMESGFYGDYKVLGGGLYELRLDFGPGYRAYFTQQKDNIVLLFCGGDKATQRQDIQVAKKYLDELKRRLSHE